MIDTVKAYLHFNPESESISLTNLYSRLVNPKTTEGNNSMGFLNGYLKNIKVSVQYDTRTQNATRLSIVGSVPKFLFSNNIASCSSSDIQTFIDTLTSALDVDVSTAIVSCLDFGLNFSVNRPIPEYIMAIKGYPRLPKRGFQGESVTMSTKSQNWAITFYDKIKEVKAKQKTLQPTNIPSELMDLNILRYEVRYRKQPHKKFKNTEQLQLKDLSTKWFHKLLFEHLKTKFTEVEFQELKFPTTNLVDSSGFLKTYLALVGLHHCGYENIRRIIESQDFDVKNQAVKRCTLKKQLKKLAGQNNELHNSSIKSVLEEKFDTLECTLY